MLVALALLALLASGGCRAKKYENPITKDTQQPDKVLFDKAVSDLEHGRYEVARLTLNTLMNTYDTSEYLAKAKLAIADSWMREGGAHAWSQAEAEYKDFILFYPQLEESAEAQMKVCDIQIRQMDKADRDPLHALKADEECRKVLTAFPNSRFAPQAAQKVRQVQEIIAQGEYMVGDYYHAKSNYNAAANRLHAITEQYPLYSGTDLALWTEGDSYSKMGPRFRPQAVEAFQKLVRNYPLSEYSEDAKKHLRSMEAEIPEADPVSLARMKYELENRTRTGLFTRFWETVASRPDFAMAAKSGEPATASLRPATPASVPIPVAAQANAGGVTDVSVATDAGATPTPLDAKPDARLNQPAGKTADASPAKAEETKVEAAKPPEPISAAQAAKAAKKGKITKAQLAQRPKRPKPSTPHKAKPVVNGPGTAKTPDQPAATPAPQK
jgi:outer membrane protein assembly factor BamD